MNLIKPEILAPVGSKEAFYSAIAAGCDALYLGGKSFGARAYADNFTDDELRELVEYAHLFDVQVYYTLNTLVKDIEFKALDGVLQLLDRILIDAVIIQDLGVYSFIKEKYPALVIHASTQMNLHSVEDAAIVRKLGFDRIVLSRECSLQQIKMVKKQVDVEIEAFVHGALCYCYSGQCLMSSAYGGRSGNRGKCAQPCRLPYTIDDEKAYFLSLKDQMTLRLLPDLIKAGIDSFKIEGRMKGAEYVYLAVSLYKKYTELAIDLVKQGKESQYRVSHEDIKGLSQLFNRGNFTDGYYKQHNSKKMISYDHSKNLGLKIGSLTSGKTITIKSDQLIEADDLLEIHMPGDLSVKTFKLNQSLKGTGSYKRLYTPNQEVISLHDLGKNKVFDLYRLRDTALLNRLGDFSIRKMNIKLSIRARLGEKFQAEAIVGLKSGSRRVAISSLQEIEVASKRPISQEDIRKRFNKTKDTHINFSSITIDMDDNIFMPIGEINHLRRELVMHIEECLKKDYLRPGRSLASLTKGMENGVTFTENLDNGEYNPPRGFSVYCKSTSQLMAVVDYATRQKTSLCRVYYDLVNKDHKEIIDSLRLYHQKVESSLKNAQGKLELFLVLPHVVFQEYKDNFIQLMDVIKDENYDGFMIRSLGQIAMVKAYHKKLVSDYNLHAFNKRALASFKDIGLHGVTLSPELHEKGLKTIVKQDNTYSESLVYGLNALMHSSNCLYKTRYETCDNHIKGHELLMEDRKNMKQYVSCNCSFCYNTIYNAKPLYLLDKYDSFNGKRGDFINESEEEVVSILKVMDGRGQAVFSPDLHTRGHFNKGVL